MFSENSTSGTKNVWGSTSYPELLYINRDAYHSIYTNLCWKIYFLTYMGTLLRSMGIFFLIREVPWSKASAADSLWDVQAWSY